MATLSGIGEEGKQGHALGTFELFEMLPSPHLTFTLFSSHLELRSATPVARRAASMSMFVAAISASAFFEPRTRAIPIPRLAFLISVGQFLAVPAFSTWLPPAATSKALALLGLAVTPPSTCGRSASTTLAFGFSVTPGARRL